MQCSHKTTIQDYIIQLSFSRTDHSLPYTLPEGTVNYRLDYQYPQLLAHAKQKERRNSAHNTHSGGNLSL